MKFRLDTQLDAVKIDRKCGDESRDCRLRIEFDGTANIDFRNVSEVVVLPPGVIDSAQG